MSGGGAGRRLRYAPGHGSPSAHHLGDPDRRERRRASRGRRVVLEHPQPLTDLHGPDPVLGVLDPDLRQAVVHRPLQPVRGVRHLRLDDVEQSCQVETLRLLRHAFGGQRPAGARDHRIRIGEPSRAQLFGVRVLLDHVVHEPVVHLGGVRLAQHGVQLGSLERLRTADQDRQQSRRTVARLPEPAREFRLRLQPFRERAQLGEVHAVVVAVPLVDRAGLRVLQRGQLGHHLGHRHPGRRRLGHVGLLSITCGFRPRR